MGPVIKREDLEQVLAQINGRFDWFTKEIENINKRLDALEKAAPAKAVKEAAK